MTASAHPEIVPKTTFLAQLAYQSMLPLSEGVALLGVGETGSCTLAEIMAYCKVILVGPKQDIGEETRRGNNHENRGSVHPLASAPFAAVLLCLRSVESLLLLCPAS